MKVRGVSEVHSGCSAPANRIAKMKIQLFWDKNRSQTVACLRYPNCSYSGLIRKAPFGTYCLALKKYITSAVHVNRSCEITNSPHSRMVDQNSITKAFWSIFCMWFCFLCNKSLVGIKQTKKPRILIYLSWVIRTSTREQIVRNEYVAVLCFMRIT